MKQTLQVALAFLLAASIGFAGSIKTWSSNDVLTSSDLNGNFQHIHNTMVGGHGARLINADVASNAAITYTKVTVSPATPKCWGTFNLDVDGGLSEITDGGPTSNNYQISATYISTGQAAILCNGAAPMYGVVSEVDRYNSKAVNCHFYSYGVSGGRVACYKLVSPGAGDVTESPINGVVFNFVGFSR